MGEDLDGRYVAEEFVEGGGEAPGGVGGQAVEEAQARFAPGLGVLI